MNPTAIATVHRLERPLVASLVDRTLGLLPRSLRGPRTPEEVLAAASSRTGIEPAAPLPGWDALCALSADMSEEALTPLGEFIAGEVMRTSTENALRFARWCDQHPEVPNGRPDPVVIVGLHRTGTTLLHTLLSSRLQASTYWEFLRPVPDTSSGSRQREGRMATGLAGLISPELGVVHPVRWDSPEECWVAMQTAYGAYGFSFHYALPRYRQVLLDTRMVEAFTVYRRILGMLAHQRQDPRRWVLKCPEHLPFLDTLFAVFPQAKVVWTHRDPSVTVPSFASLSAIQRRMLRGRYDPHRTGREVQAGLADSLERGMALRQRGLDVFDLRYDDLVADPLGAAQRIAAWAGIEADDFEMPPRTHGPPHIYPRAWFGLTDEEPSIFAAYRDAFLGDHRPV